MELNVVGSVNNIPNCLLITKSVEFGSNWDIVFSCNLSIPSRKNRVASFTHSSKSGIHWRYWGEFTRFHVASNPSMELSRVLPWLKTAIFWSSTPDLTEEE